MQVWTQALFVTRSHSYIRGTDFRMPPDAIGSLIGNAGTDPWGYPWPGFIHRFIHRLYTRRSLGCSAARDLGSGPVPGRVVRCVNVYGCIEFLLCTYDSQGGTWANVTGGMNPLFARPFSNGPGHASGGAGLCRVRGGMGVAPEPGSRPKIFSKNPQDYENLMKI